MRSVSKVRSLANVRCDLCYCYHRPGQVRHLLSSEGQSRVNVGEWDWEAFQAHKRGLPELQS